MDDAGPIAGIFIVLLFLDIFVYAYSAALQNLDEIEVERRAEEKDKKSIRLFKLLNHPNGYVNTVQMITTMINMAAGALFVRFSALHLTVPETVAWALALLYIFLTFGVLLPKRLAARNAEKISYTFAGIAEVILIILAPFTGAVSLTARGILFLCGIKGREDESDVTEKEIINMVQEGFEQGVIEDNEAEMITNIFAYGDKEAQDIMTHRNNVVAIDGNMHLKEAIDFMLAGTNSRYPVYEENIDHVIGILHLKDAMRYHRKDDKADGRSEIGARHAHDAAEVRTREIEADDKHGKRSVESSEKTYRRLEDGGKRNGSEEERQSYCNADSAGVYEHRPERTPPLLAELES